MTAPSFSDFYLAAHGRPPFPWQQRLSERVLEGEWPAVDVPTGCGKTSVIDVAVHALAAQAERPPFERSPLRIFFIIDRRLVVDDVFNHAAALAESIRVGTAEPLAWARERLRSFGGAKPLDVAIMRGGMYRSNTWADMPNQPLVCVSTVDQAGSRLLFRGYGVSDAGLPIQAAFLGTDSLLVMDEAHLSKPFLQTVASVNRYQGEGWRNEPVAPGIRVVEMSATRQQDDRPSHRLADADYACEALQPRLERPKIADLKEVTKLPESAADEAVKIASEGVVGVVLNTVAAARATFEELGRRKHQAILLTGRIRSYDRDKLLETHLETIRVGAKREPGKRFFVVATQTIEVGADLDFDALVTEAAPIDSLRQRFGRLNRIGRLEIARASILKPKRSREKDYIYGDAADKTWDWLTQHAANGAVDFGVRAMGSLFETDGSAELLPEKRDAPLLLPAHLEAWAQTSPRPAVEPDVAPFLHGRDEDLADVQIVWRGDLDAVNADDPRTWPVLLEAAPPVSTEALPLPFFAARKWLEGKAATIADIEGPATIAVEDDEPAQRPFLIWRGPEDSSIRLSDLRPGDTVVVRSSVGGCDEFGWDAASNAPVSDIGDKCANARVRGAGGRYRIRIHKGVMPRLAEAVDQALKLVQDDEEITEDLEILFKEEAGAEAWGRVRAYGRNENALLMESRRMPSKKAESKLHEEDEREDGDSSSLTAQVTLDDHTNHVVQKVLEFAAGCRLNGQTPAVEAAAKLHDLGKLDERFQYILSPTAISAPLAKSGKISRTEYLRRREQSGLPAGARHEFASVQLAQENGLLPQECNAELALYLIGAHHGFGRPFPPVWDDGGHTISAIIDGQTYTIQDAHRVGGLGSGWVDRYAALTRKYGWWGLAFLETILRRADCIASREEEEQANA